MRILAIDPGYDRVGIAILEGTAGNPSCLHSECFITDRKQSSEKRLYSISKKVKSVIDEYKPGKMALESLFFSVNQKTAIGVSEARGVILGEAGGAGIPVVSLNPNQVKVAVTNYGACKKQAIIDMVKRLVKTRLDIKYDDEYDAIAIGIAALALAKNNI